MAVRTEQQNKALHLFFTHLATQLNEAGLDMRRTLKPEVDISWTPETVKEYLWRPIQMAATGKESTKDLETREIDEVFEIISKHLGEKFGLQTEFPSVESIINQMRQMEGR